MKQSWWRTWTPLMAALKQPVPFSIVVKEKHAINIKAQATY
jgi:hypothetical protein